MRQQRQQPAACPYMATGRGREATAYLRAPDVHLPGALCRQHYTIHIERTDGQPVPTPVHGRPSAVLGGVAAIQDFAQHSRSGAKYVAKRRHMTAGCCGLCFRNLFKAFNGSLQA